MKIYVSLFILLLGTDIYGQMFGDQNAEWVYDHDGFVPGVTIVRKLKDTIVQDQQVSIFNKTALRMDNDGELIKFQLDHLYIRQHDGLIEFSEDLFYFDTLYNFDLSIGESWTVPERDLLTREPTGFVIERTVIDTFSQNINGIPVFCQAVRVFQNNFVDTIYSNIGTTASYILPFDFKEVALDGGEGGVLRCFNDDQIGLLEYEYPFFEYDGGSFSNFEYDCDQLLNNTNTIHNRNDIKIYPNPSSNLISVNSHNSIIAQVSIYNLQGKLIQKFEGGNYQVELDIGHLYSGVYLIQVDNQPVKKLVVLK